MHRIRAIILPLSAAAVMLLAATAAGPAQARYCGSYGVMCHRAWSPQERPDFLSRLHAPDGDYMGSIFLADGNCSFLGTGLNCRPCGDVQVEDWDKVCNERFSECQGECFAE